MATDHDPDFLTPAQAAELASVSVKTINRWDQSGKLEGVRRTLGGHRRYSRWGLTAALAQASAEFNNYQKEDH